MSNKLKVEKLVSEINMARELYYLDGSSPYSDSEFDKLEEELKTLDPNNPILDKIGAPAVIRNKLEHETPMLSLDKTYSLKELLYWKKDHDLVVTHKIDGSSCSLVYDTSGNLELAKTRGDGKFGEDVAEHIKFIKNIPKTLKDLTTVEVRGEIVCLKSRFKELSDKMESLGLERPNSERNIVAGLLGRKNHIELCEYLHFFAYNLIEYPWPGMTEFNDFDQLRKSGFETPEYYRVKSDGVYGNITRDITPLETFLDRFDQNKTKLDYLVDGLVFAINDKVIQSQMGYTGHHPRYKMAFKFKSEEKTVEIKDIKWQLSRNGVLTPVAVIEPTELSGALVENVTLHNFGVVRDNVLNIGTRIKVTRSGEVIPKFLEVVENPNSEYFKIKFCPSCGQDVALEKVEDYKTPIRLVCENECCFDVVREQILNFMTCIGIENISTKRLEEMMTSLGVKSPSDLYRLREEDFLKLNKVKDKLAKTMFQTIQSTKNPKLLDFLVSLGLVGGGEGKIAKILDSGISSIEEFLDMGLEKLILVDSFALKSAENLIKSRDTNKELIKSLLEAGVLPKINKKIEITESKFTGKSVCITGALSVPRKEIEEKLKQMGAKVVGSVSKKTDFLLTNEPDSGSEKAQKAKELGVLIISEKEIIDG